jgi:uncharacterized membrane protein YbjE (DUF340 family)
MTELMICITIGIAIGWSDKLNIKMKKILDKISLFSLFLMLWCLGAKIGCDKELLAKLDIIGLKSVELAFFVIAGSILGVWVVVKIFSFFGMEEIESEEAKIEDEVKEVAKKRKENLEKVARKREGK